VVAFIIIDRLRFCKVFFSQRKFGLAHRASDLQQRRAACLCRCRAEVGKHRRRVEIRHAAQIVIVHIIRRVDAAAGEQFILDAGADDVAERDLNIEIVQFL